MMVTPSLFRLLDADPALGRTFTEDESQIGDSDRVVLSYGLWQDLYAGDPAAVGARLRISDRPFTVVGIMPGRFSFFDSDARFWIPAALTPAEQNNSSDNIWYHVGRLASGATLAQAQAHAVAADRTFLESAPFLREIYREAGYHTTVEPLEKVLVRRTGTILYLLWGGAIVLLLVAGLNIANMTLVRSHLQARELVTRMALGAGRRRLAGLFLAEGLLISLAAGILGLAVGSVVFRSVGILNIDHLLTFAGDLNIRPVVVAFVLGLSMIVGLAIGMAPLANLNRLNLGEALHEADRSGTSGRGVGRVRKVMVTAQVSMTFVLLVAAGLLLTTLVNLLSVDTGFSGENVATTAVDIQGEQYNVNPVAQELLDRSLQAIRTIPGVVSAAATTMIPLSGSRDGSAAIPEGVVPASDNSIVVPAWARVSPGFFDTMNAPLILGRDFDDRDKAQTAITLGTAGEGVAIVDEVLARKFWPGENAVGKRMFLPGVRNTAEVRENTRWLRIIGVAPELRLVDLASRESSGTIYTLHGEANPGNYPTRYGFVIRTASDDPLSVVPQVRRALLAIDPELVLFDVQSMDQRTTVSLDRERLAMWLSVSFGLLALFLSAVGIYSVLSFLVAQRTREIGIRVALGGTPQQVFALVVRDGLVMAVCGLILGLAGTLVLRPILETQAYGITVDNPALIAAISAILMSVALLAAVFPANRAIRLDPIVVLGKQ